MPRDFFHGRHAGLLVPLFSIPSRESWGIGEIGDLPRLGAWMADAGLLVRAAAADQRDGRRAELAVFGDERDGDRSDLHLAGRRCPTSPRSAAKRCCRRRSATGSRRRATSTAIDYTVVRAVKLFALPRRRSSTSSSTSGRRDTNRARPAARRSSSRRGGGSTTTRSSARCTRAQQGRAWQEWDAPLRDRDAGGAGDGARRSWRPRSSSTRYLQWLAAQPVARRRATRADIGIFGDFPFMVSGDSADVWARQEDFRLDASVGAPPDAFSETGQDWGFPAYRWDVIAAERLRVAGGARAPQRRALRRLPRRSSRRLLPHLRARERRRGGVRAGRRARSDASRGSACSTCSAPPARGSSPRTSASSRRSCARRWRGSRFPATR